MLLHSVPTHAKFFNAKIQKFTLDQQSTAESFAGSKRSSKAHRESEQLRDKGSHAAAVVGETELDWSQAGRH